MRLPDALVLEDVTHDYGAVRAVDRVSLTVGPGELVSLLGPSGCGKTTVLRLAAGVEHLQAGRVLLAGQVVADGRTAVPPEDRGVGLVFQDYALFPHLTVRDNVGFGLHRLTAGERPARIDAVLEQMGMAGQAEAYPHMLSGGQQQRVALARALAPRPKVLLLDEPFSGLDARLREAVRDETLHILKSTGTATLLVTHDSEEAMFMADRIALMRGGAIVQEGTPAELYYHPTSAFVAGFFSQTNRLTGRVERGWVATPFGDVAAATLAEGTTVEVLIRPEALRLTRGSETPLAGNVAQVLASRMLGRTSLVHLSARSGNGAALHMHSRMPGRFLPPEGETVLVNLDYSQTFVFPLADPR
jgi:iron(III) transport system ATP-binding protein